MPGPFCGILCIVRAAVGREAARRRFVRLLESDDATLEALGCDRAELRLAFLLHEQRDAGDPASRPHR